MRRMTELPDPEEDRVGVFPVLCRKMSFNSAMQKASSGRFVCMVVFPLMMKSFLLSICLTWLENARLYFANFAAFVHYINADQHSQQHTEALHVQCVRRHIFSRAEVKRVQQQADQQRADVGVRGDTFYKSISFRSGNAPALTSTHGTPSRC